ncbi:MAG: hypothetical protein HOE45_09830 [Gammaproteobacteria bacterium]|nr:hypothetical protein [Gammaproteobacteria bacterium]
MLNYVIKFTTGSSPAREYRGVGCLRESGRIVICVLAMPFSVGGVEFSKPSTNSLFRLYCWVLFRTPAYTDYFYSLLMIDLMGFKAIYDKHGLGML